MQATKNLFKILPFVILLAVMPTLVMAASGDPVVEGDNAGSVQIKGECQTAMAGTATAYTTTTSITGSGTSFTSLRVGDAIKINNETLAIASIASATGLSVVTAPTSVSNGGSYSLYYDSALISTTNAAATAGPTMDGSGYWSKVLNSGVTVLEAGASATAIAAAESLTPTIGTFIQLAGSDGAGGYTLVNLSSNPQIADGKNGQVLILQGTSDANTVQFNDGNGLQTAAGAAMALGDGDILALIYDVTADIWHELFRANN